MTDAEQRKVIELCDRNALVLAGPGCGKTHILARRVFHATMARGIAPETMLCLTFTNRAAREMNDRISSYVGHVPIGLFVGNMHRFCLRFLYTNRLLDQEASVIDDEDLAIFCHENRSLLTRVGIECVQRADTVLFMEENNFESRLMPRLKGALDNDTRKAVAAYRLFKLVNNLLDYDDILLQAYVALRDNPPEKFTMTGYKWIQIDEVQDLSPLQLTLVDLLQGPSAEVLYLGDEQQSIYGFAGAGRRALESVKQRCRGHLYRLTRNYRSPQQLVEFCNEYAYQYLEIDREFLPDSVNGPTMGTCLTLGECPRSMSVLTSAMARRYLSNTGESVAVLTRTNNEARLVSETLALHGLDHILVSQNDLFKSVAFKTVWSHLAVCSDPGRQNPWARLLYQTHATSTLSEARLLIAKLSETGISAEQLLDLDGISDIEFACLADGNADTLVIIDTETTGLNVVDDDIVQISAVKMIGGKIIAGSELNIFIETEKTLPEYLGISRNPLYDTYANSPKTPPTQAYSMLAEYIGNAIITGHNIQFDKAILRNNMKRAGVEIPEALKRNSPAIDTLKLSRLLYPNLRSHALDYMAGYLGINAGTSHNALDDVLTTSQLLIKLLPAAKVRIPDIEEFRSSRQFRRVALKFSENYGKLYHSTRELMESDSISEQNTLSGAFIMAYKYLRYPEFIKEIPHTDYLCDLISNHVVDRKTEPRLRDQLNAHLTELLSFNEGDLFVQDIIKERLVVMTIHKAKGMEMDNVIVYNAGMRFGTLEESMRVFYVAISRARKRLALLFNSTPGETIGMLEQKFRIMRQSEISIMLMNERTHRI